MQATSDFKLNVSGFLQLAVFMGQCACTFLCCVNISAVKVRQHNFWDSLFGYADSLSAVTVNAFHICSQKRYIWELYFIDSIFEFASISRADHAARHHIPCE